MTEAIVSILILVGVFFIAAGTLGLLRLPDVYNRLHATTKSATLGVVSILAATVVYFSSVGPALYVKIGIAVVFLYVSSPIGAHMISRAAYAVGVPLADQTVRDDYKGHRQKVNEVR